MQATLNTSMGNIVCELFPEQAPVTVENFAGLAEEFERRMAGELPANWEAEAQKIVESLQAEGGDVATRKSSQIALNAYGPLLPELIGGSADLAGSNNTIWSGSTDVLEGGDGADIFAFDAGANTDVITDFEAGSDRIEIRRFDADKTLGRKQFFDFIGDEEFSNTAGELRFEYDEALDLTLVQGDQTGNGQADFEIALSGDITLTEVDFFI